MQELRRKLARICASNVPVLLLGEVGVGKGVLSRFIHAHSNGIDGLYQRVNCAALWEQSMDWDPIAALLSQARSGAGNHDGTGTAITGTVYLDQVSELTPLQQLALSHSLAQYDEQKRKGRQAPLTRVRTICASTRDLRKEVKLGRFRRDVYDCIAVVAIEVPPLRDRIEDLPVVSEYLRRRCSADLGVADTPFPGDLLARMMGYRWPGNIRELESFVCRYVVLGGDLCTVEEGSPHLNRRLDKHQNDSYDLDSDPPTRKWRS